MNPLTFVTMVFCTYISLMITRSLAPYGTTENLKYISLNSDFLIKYLLPKRKGYVKVNDRKKISVFSLVFYILFVVLIIALVVLFILPDIPCEPFVGVFGRRSHAKWIINTLNEKLIYLLPILFSLLEFITFIILEIPTIIKRKSESKKAIFALFAIIALFVGLLVFVAFQLF